jgi:tRNA (adenine57-N1/adenine58-N1)-methyltransferase
LITSKSSIAKEGDLVELVGLGYKHFMIRLEAGAEFHTHRGVVKHDDVIGHEWGSQIFSHMGSPFFMLQPAMPDLLKDIPRATQILYPKDISFVLMSLGIGPGVQVIEAGTGSGALTIALAYAVGKEGRVFSYEIKESAQNTAVKNLQRLGLDPVVEFHLRDIGAGFDERDVDALFLDVPNPYDYIAQARTALKSGGFFGSICPTANQVIMLLNALRQNGFAFLDVCEVSVRYFKPEPLRFRPTDRMVAHTGFLVFGRPVTIDPNQADRKLLKETRLISVLDEGDSKVTTPGIDENDTVDTPNDLS